MSTAFNHNRFTYQAKVVADQSFTIGEDREDSFEWDSVGEIHETIEVHLTDMQVGKVYSLVDQRGLSEQTIYDWILEKAAELERETPSEGEYMNE